jgi:hypothetical protein
MRFLIMTCCTDEYTSVLPLEIFILRGKRLNPINWFNNPRHNCVFVQSRNVYFQEILLLWFLYLAFCDEKLMLLFVIL